MRDQSNEDLAAQARREAEEAEAWLRVGEERRGGGGLEWVTVALLVVSATLVIGIALAVWKFFLL